MPKLTSTVPSGIDNVAVDVYFDSDAKVKVSLSQRKYQVLLHKDIDSMFFNRQVCDPLRFANFVKNNLPECSTSNIARFVRLAGKKSIGKSQRLLKEHLPAVALSLKVLTYSSSWCLKEVSSVIYGLQCQTAKDAGYLSILETMSKIASRLIKKTSTSSSKNMSMLLYGLQRNTCSEQESRNLLKVVAKIVLQCNDTLSAQAVANSLYGLQSMTNSCIEVQTLISALTLKVRGCTEVLGAQELSNALYGLQGMTSDNIEVRALVSALTPKAESCREMFSAQGVGNSLYGLQGMNSDSVEVRALVSALTARVKSCKESLDGQLISHSLYGLQGMTSDIVEVRALVSALTPKVQSCKEVFGAQAVSNTLYGLQGMSCDSVEVRALVSALAVKIKGCKEPLNAQAVSNALYGLQGFIRSPLSQPLLATLLSHLCKLAQDSGNFQSLPYSDIEFLGHGFAFSLHSLHTCLNSVDYKKWEDLNQSVSNMLVSPKYNLHCAGKIPSVLEQRFQRIISKIDLPPAYLLSFNETLFQLFEGDIILRIPRADHNSHLVMNIEIDGSLHLRKKKMNFCVQRDKYLRTKGVVVERMPSARFIRMKDNDVEKWFLEMVADAALLSSERLEVKMNNMMDKRTDTAGSNSTLTFNHAIPLI